MKKVLLFLLVAWAGATLAQGSQSQSAGQSSQASGASSQTVRPIGVVTQIQAGSFTLHSDAGPDLLIQLPDGVAVVRVPPGSKDLKTATKINVSDISSGDRVLVRGRFSDDQKSVAATSVIVMSKTDLASAREAERLEWQRRGIGGLVKAVNPATKEITISVPNTPPTPENPTHPVTIVLAANATLLRYAPDSVKFGEAQPSPFEGIKVGDQVRALGTKSEDGSRFTAEKVVSGTFRNLGATVVSVDAGSGAITVKDLASGKPVLVKTNADSKLYRLSPFLAQMIAMFNSGQTPNGGAGGGTSAGAPARPPGENAGNGPRSGEVQGRTAGSDAGGGRSSGAMGGRPSGGGFGGGPGGGMRDFNQMLERTPPLKLDELKLGDALIVVSTAGADPSQVTAIVVLAGVEPILSARPKGSTDVVMGPWNMSMGGGDAGP